MRNIVLGLIVGALISFGVFTMADRDINLNLNSALKSGGVTIDQSR